MPNRLQCQRSSFWQRCPVVDVPYRSRRLDEVALQPAGRRNSLFDGRIVKTELVQEDHFQESAQADGQIVQVGGLRHALVRVREIMRKVIPHGNKVLYRRIQWCTKKP